MDFTKLLCTEIPCECGRTHYCTIKYVIIEEGAISKLGNLLDGYSNIVLAGDKNTYSVCGDFVEKQIGAKLENRIVFGCEGLLVPDETSIVALDAAVSSKTDLIVGIGSGVINDLCKYVSFRRKLPYYIVATAPSMDGYASSGAAMITDKMKVTYTTHIPQAIIADTEVLQNAPLDMIKSGYGDIIGKYSCLNDWRLSSLVRGEYFCHRAYDMIREALNTVSSLGNGLLQRNRDSIRALMEALVCTGIAMSYVGNSRPASGSEHHMSHFFEITGLLESKPYFLHGLDVGYSTVITQRLREKLLTLTRPVCRPFDRSEWETDIRRLYTAAADGVITLQNDTGWYDYDWQSVYTAKWDEIKDLLREAPSSTQFERLLNAGGMFMEDFVHEYGEDKIRSAALFAKDLKSRYTVLWPYYQLIGKSGMLYV